MKILSKSQYGFLLEQIKNLKAENRQLKQKINVLENDKQILLLLINPDIAHIDFPNSMKGGTDDPSNPDQLDIWSL